MSPVRVHDAMIKLDPSFRVAETPFRKVVTLLEEAIKKGWAVCTSKLGRKIRLGVNADGLPWVS